MWGLGGLMFFFFFFFFSKIFSRRHSSKKHGQRNSNNNTPNQSLQCNLILHNPYTFILHPDGLIEYFAHHHFSLVFFHPYLVTVRICRTESFQCWYVPLLSTISAVSAGAAGAAAAPAGVGVGSVVVLLMMVVVIVRRWWARSRRRSGRRRRRKNDLVGPGQRCLVRVMIRRQWRRRVLSRPAIIVHLLPRSQMTVMCRV